MAIINFLRCNKRSLLVALSEYADDRVFKVTAFTKVSLTLSTEWLPASTKHGQVQYTDFEDNFI